jgi:hypothetical protein
MRLPGIAGILTFGADPMGLPPAKAGNWLPGGDSGLNRQRCRGFEGPEE